MDLDEEIVNLVNSCWDDIEKAKSILEEKDFLINAHTGIDETALTLLIRWYSSEKYTIAQHVEAVKMLLAFGFDVNDFNSCGSSPIYNAIALGDQLEVVKLLLENGVKINPSYQGFMGESLLGTAVIAKNIEQIEFLLQNGIDINSPNDFDETPLHKSIEDDEMIDITKLLLSYGADIHIQDGFTNTPLHIASTEDSSIESMKLLLSNGADMNRLNDFEETPLEVAVRLNALLNVQLLIEYGALKGVVIENLIHIASKNDSKDVADFLNSLSSLPVPTFTHK